MFWGTIWSHGYAMHLGYTGTDVVRKRICSAVGCSINQNGNFAWSIGKLQSRQIEPHYWTHQPCISVFTGQTRMLVPLSRVLFCSNFDTFRPTENGGHFPDDTFMCIFLNENAWISIKISVQFIPKGPISKIPVLAQIMGWRRTGEKPLSEAMMV